ncbi:MAG: sporulation integral membrane protein YlbJ, partial [Bacillota bacterium]|nr:sporulation integral membrane protein YlbJ [Bacillota bacterium]
MWNYFVIGLSIICVLLVIKRKRFDVIYIKDLLIPMACIAFILLLVIFSKTAVNSASKGIKLWLDIAFPSLFPFFVGVEILNNTGLIKVIGVLLEPVMRPLFNLPGCSSFPFAMGLTSGYPVGAKITASMREKEMLSKTEAERLIAFSNNSGPLFIVGAVSVGMYNMPELGPVLLLCHIAACICVGISFRFYGRKDGFRQKAVDISVWKKFKYELKELRKRPRNNLGTLLGDAVRNSVMTILAIGGFIILFSVIINLLVDSGFIDMISGFFSSILSPFGVNPDVINSSLCGFFEITTGTSMASKAAGAALIQQLTVTSFIIGWAGLSVHSQVYSIVSKTDISMKPYLLGKFLQGV